MKLFIVTEYSDPYEPSGTTCICDSVESAKALGFKELWLFDGKEYTELVSGLKFPRDVCGSFGPQPRCEWVEMNQMLAKSAYINNRVYDSPLRGK